MEAYRDISDIPKHTFDEISHFFEVYKSLEGKRTFVKEIVGREAAQKIIRTCMDNYDRKFGLNK